MEGGGRRGGRAVDMVVIEAAHCATRGGCSFPLKQTTTNFSFPDLRLLLWRRTWTGGCLLMTCKLRIIRTLSVRTPTREGSYPPPPTEQLCEI